MKIRRRKSRNRKLPRHAAFLRPLGIETLEQRWLLNSQEFVPGFSKAFSPSSIGPGSVTTLTFTIDNSDTPVPTDMMAFTDILPAEIRIATPANASHNCTTGILTAPDGGSTITFSDGSIGAFSSCTISVDVTSDEVGEGPWLNLSGDLTSNHGNSGTAMAELTVDAGLPGFTKSFSPSSVNLGSRSELTFTIDNTANGSDVVTLDFTDNLPVGLVIADPPSASTNCGDPQIPATLTATAGGSIITLNANGNASFPALDAGATCTVTVDVVATGVGSLGNTSGDLLAVIGGQQFSSGKAAAVLDVTREDIHVQKEFLADPVAPGGTVDVKFTITNFNRDFPATGIAFTDDLDAALSGLVATGLPVAACGGTLSGTDTLSLTGATIAAGESCMFTVTLQVPSGAASGDYINTTSTITADIDGMGVVGAAAEDALFVSTAPTLTKEFTDDPVGGGGTVMLEFTITNNSASVSATDIAFTDALPIVIEDAVMPPASVCNGGTLNFTPLDPGSLNPASEISVTGASLGPGASCSFTVELELAVGSPGGIYPNTTSQITATVDEEAVTGNAASDDLTVVAAPTLTKQFLDDPPVQPGDTVTLEFTLSHDETAPGDATGITFTDDLAAAIPGLTATLPPVPDPPCGVGSSLTASMGGTLLTFAGGTLMPGETCTFSVTLNVPAGATPGGHTNTTSNVSATVLGAAAEEKPATDDLNIAGLELTKEFINDPAVPGGQTTLRFTIENITAASDATSIFFTDNLDNTLSGLTAPGPLNTGSCDGSLVGTSNLIYFGGSLMAGQSCSFDVTLDVPAGAAGDTYVNTTSGFSGDFGAGAVMFDNATDDLVVVEEKTSIIKQFTDDPVGAGGTVTLEFTITNESPANAASNISFTDDLNAALSGLMATSAISDDCGGVASAFPTGMFGYSGGSLAPLASCTISLSVDVPGGAAAGSYLNTTSTITADINGNMTTGDPGSDALDVIEAGERPLDFGDAPTGGPIGAPPDSYPTLLAQDGARHVVVAGAPTLGPNIDADDDGQPNATATGDDVNLLYAGVAFPPGDEDGVTFTQLVYVANGLGTMGSVDVDLQNADPTQNLLNAWIDFNRDGDWLDSGEQIFTDFNLGTSNGVQTLMFNIPADTGPNVVSGGTFARFRLSTVGGLTPRGEAPNGEVEDHTLNICSTHVSTTADSGDGSLRDAINCANSAAGTDTITFNITPNTISPLSPLPNITDPVVIDGTTDPNFSGTPVVELDGSSAGAAAKGLTVLAGPSTIEGLVINRWTDVGIFLGSGSDGSFVDLNYIGTNVAGTAALPNSTGIRINQSSNNTIGTGAGGNLISGNTGSGVRISSATSTGNNVWHNLIGTDITGNTALDNYVGVEVASAQGNNIGGTSGSQGNIISGNFDVGVVLRGDSNNVLGNRIGTNLAGDGAVPNSTGVEISVSTGNTIGGTSANAGNQISGNTNSGVLISGATATGNFVQGNLIGLNDVGTAALPNKNGVEIDGAPSNTIGATVMIAINNVGGPLMDAGNTISGNTKNAILIRNAGATGNLVQANKLGTDPSGTSAVPNGRGVLIDDAVNNQIGTGDAGNLISGNTAEGVRIQDSGSTGNTVQGNAIGFDETETMTLPNNIGVRIRNLATANTIGGDSTAGEGNVIAGNTLDGVSISNANGNFVYGNIIGTNSAGAVMLGNGSDGVEVTSSSQNTAVGGSGTGEGNVISGNVEFGVRLRGTSNTLLGNRIGTDPGGTMAVANLSGVYIFGSSNTIGGANPGEGNVISGNTNGGVRLDGASATGNMVFGNLIGLNAAGTGPLANKYGVYATGAPSNFIGGANNGEGNTISGNTLHGVYLQGPDTTGNIVEGNRIGTDESGTSAFANQAQGVLIEDATGNTIGGTTVGAENVIAGNTLDGVKISGATATANVLEGNIIGEDLFNNPIPNRNGVLIADGASDNTIGDGTDDGSNTIADNNQRGIWVNANAGTGNTISHNSIHNNGGTLRLGIDLGGSGVTPNDPGDPDVGANNLQNFPVLLSAVLSNPSLVISYSVDAPLPLTVEFFVADSDAQEGEQFLSSDNYTSAGATQVVIVPPGPAMGGSKIVATATDANGNTSEFSAPITVMQNLVAAAGENSRASSGTTQALSADQLPVIVDAAVTRLGQLGLDEGLLANVQVSIADLPGAVLSQTAGKSIVVDVNAAGHGWFVDDTPLDDVEFGGRAGVESQQSILNARRHIDLLTAVMHELGHTAGMLDLANPDAENDVMFGSLEIGVRKMSLEASLADEAFAEL